MFCDGFNGSETFEWALWVFQGMRSKDFKGSEGSRGVTMSFSSMAGLFQGIFGACQGVIEAFHGVSGHSMNVQGDSMEFQKDKDVPKGVSKGLRDYTGCFKRFQRAPGVFKGMFVRSHLILS